MSSSYRISNHIKPVSAIMKIIQGKKNQLTTTFMHVLVIITQHIRSEVKSSNDNKIKWNRGERSKKGIKEEIGGKGRKKNNLIIKYFNNSQGVRLNINNMTRNEKLTFTIYGLFVGINDDYCLFIIYCFLSSVIHH